MQNNLGQKIGYYLGLLIAVGIAAVFTAGVIKLIMWMF